MSRAAVAVRARYAVSVAVTVVILVAMFVSLVRHFWPGVALSLVVDAGFIWWGVREFVRDNHIGGPQSW
jgi:hypothetical protein